MFKRFSEIEIASVKCHSPRTVLLVVLPSAAAVVPSPSRIEQFVAGRPVLLVVDAQLVSASAHTILADR